MPRAPATKPKISPPMIPPTMDRNATGLTFGGPPARMILVADIALEKQANNARILVLSGKCITPVHFMSRETIDT